MFWLDMTPGLDPGVVTIIWIECSTNVLESIISPFFRPGSLSSAPCFINLAGLPIAF